MPGTPKKFRKLIQRKVESLSPSGVPDTVAYITENEVRGATKGLKKLGYREKDLRSSFTDIDQPISFARMNFQ